MYLACPQLGATTTQMQAETAETAEAAWVSWVSLQSMVEFEWLSARVAADGALRPIVHCDVYGELCKMHRTSVVVALVLRPVVCAS
jgi:hypothetical protein